MRISVVGAGYVGLVTAACLADSGNHVLAVEIDEKKVRSLAAGQCPIYEPGLEELLVANLSAGRLSFTTDLKEGIDHGEVIFITVGTPPRPDGAADLSAVSSIIHDIAKGMTSAKMVVIKSTVPVGTGRHMSEIMAEGTAHPFAVASNPEFLREGAALADFLHPDRVIIGCDDEEAVQLLIEVYSPFVQTERTIMVMSREAAEMVKYASNAYLAARISFINEIAEICAHTGVDIGEVRAGMGADHRIGPNFLYPGAGYGGSCFPKDVQALMRVAQDNRCQAGLLASVHERNERQKRILAEMVFKRFGGNLEGKTFAVWGLAFKPKTDDIRDAPAIRVIQLLSEAGADLNCYDPKAGPNAARQLAGLGNVHIADDPYTALKGADGLIICTEWNEFRTPDFDRIRTELTERVIFDGRNLYQAKTMLRQRIEYHSVGRPIVKPTSRYTSQKPRFGR